MSWLGLDADEGPYYQTQRFDRYREVTDQWLAEGKAYHCYCTKEELCGAPRKANEARGAGCVTMDAVAIVQMHARVSTRSFASRIPLDGEVVVNDQVRGRVAFENAQLDDLIIARSDGTPTYNFTVVIDDLRYGYYPCYPGR